MKPKQQQAKVRSSKIRRLRKIAMQILNKKQLDEMLAKVEPDQREALQATFFPYLNINVMREITQAQAALN